MTDPGSLQVNHGTARRAFAGAGCALAGVLALELALHLTGFRSVTPAAVPIIPVLLGIRPGWIAPGSGSVRSSCHLQQETIMQQ